MSAIGELGLVAGLGAVGLLSGYPLAVRLRGIGAAERAAVAVLAGLAVQLWTLGLLTLVVPLAARWIWLAAWPLVWLAADGAARRRLIEDGRALARHPRARLLALAALLPVSAILGPELVRPGLMFHDGTSNHDGYFWISGARVLQTRTCLDKPPFDRDRPWTDVARQFGGWRPQAGRAAAEAGLAAVASAVRRDPVEIYLPAATALIVTWLAAVFLLGRTFYTERLNGAGAVALGALQPLFVFFVLNGNLPNLLGALLGAAAIVALERALRAGAADAPGWLVLGALATHGLLFSYPEIGPFIVVPAAVLLARAGWTGKLGRRRAAGLAIAVLAGLALNPVTTERAGLGFLHSLAAAQHERHWANIFAPLVAVQYPPAIATLSFEAVTFFGIAGGAVGTVLLIAGLGAALHGARDRCGALATLTGGAVLAGYTVATGFDYGWQKTAQFTAVFVAAALPVAAVALGAARAERSGAWRWWRHGTGALLAAAFAIALGFLAAAGGKWSGRKALATDWLVLQRYGERTLAGRTVRVAADTFPYPFFHGMWAAYFLPEARLVYPAGPGEPAGYLSAAVRRADDPAAGAPEAMLVGRAWAEAHTAPGDRLLTGRDFALVRVGAR